MRGTKEERAAIAWVARNHATQYKATLQDIAFGRVKKPKYKQWAPTWNTSNVFKLRLAKAHKWPKWEQAKREAEAVLRGKVKNPIGRRLSFIATRTQKKLGRKLPLWMIPKRLGGTAKNEPITIGRHTFS